MNKGFDSIVWWNSLRHSGLLLDRKRLAELYPADSSAISWETVDGLRRTLELGHSQTKGSSLELIDFVLSVVCGFREGWEKGPQIGASWSRRDREGNALRPERLWTGPHGCILPVFIDKDSKTLGLGKGRRAVSKVLGWMRSGSEKLAVLTNGRQWRLLHAGLDYDAWCESDSDLWFEDGAPSAQLHALVSLLSPSVWAPTKPNGKPPLLNSVEESRKGQAELSASLGERVRLAVEKLIDAHQTAIDKHGTDIPPSELYRGAVRVVMRLVVVLFAEARGLLPVDNAVYHASYGLRGLQDDLRKLARAQRLSSSRSAWPRLLALFRLVHDGSAHPDLPVPSYGGELFQPGSRESNDGPRRAIWIFENACFKDDSHGVPDKVMSSILEHLTRTMEQIRSGRGTTNVPVPVDFSDLSSEYIGILYEGLLDYELKPVPEGDAVIILPIGNRPALPLSRLEAMTDAQLAELLAKFAKASKAKASDAEEEESEEPEEEEEDGDAENEDESIDDPSPEEEVVVSDTGVSGLGERVTNFLRRMVEQGKLVAKPRGRMTPEKEAAYCSDVEKKAIVFARDAHFPGKRYLVRWGGTRKGSGAFYTRPGLSGPLIQRTLAPLAYTAPLNADGTENRDAMLSEWTPRKPEEILALKVCDIACGSGSFPVGALRFLTQALYDSVHFHGRTRQTSDHRTAVSFFGRTDAGESIADEYLPCLPDDETYEARLRARLKRHVAERCIYGVDLDPLAVELCRLSLWVETLDQDLPFTFLNHKIKCGNSLVGCWLDEVEKYPSMAWKGRLAGDDKHTEGSHFKKGQRHKALLAFVNEVLPQEFRRASSQIDLFDHSKPKRAPFDLQSSARNIVTAIHNLPIHQSGERWKLYESFFAGNEDIARLRDALDLWCAAWFWPSDELENAPIPTAFRAASSATITSASRISRRVGFFHWELELPDVFTPNHAGFVAVLGNTAWENSQPNPEEFFSNFDPRYRAFSNPLKKVFREELFRSSASIENEWIEYNESFRNIANWVTKRALPFETLNATETKALAAKKRPFRCQVGRIFLHKLFIEQSFHLLSPSGRMGLIVPSGIYFDAWSLPLRKLCLDEGSWEWVFNFENREKIFPIDSRFKFNPIIVKKGGPTQSINVAFSIRHLEDWGNAEKHKTIYPRLLINKLSPKSQSSVQLSTSNECGWRICYNLEFVMNSSTAGIRECSEVDLARLDFDQNGCIIVYSNTEDTPVINIAPIYQGKMIWQYDYAYARFSVNSSIWEPMKWGEKHVQSQYYIPTKTSLGQPKVKLAMRDTSSPTNERTFIAAVIPNYPCSHKVPVLRGPDLGWKKSVILSTILNSLAFDYLVRMRFAPSGGGGSLILDMVSELPLWDPNGPWKCLMGPLEDIGLQLLGDWEEFGAVIESRKQERGLPDCFERATTHLRRLELRCIADALNFLGFGLSIEDARWILRDCDWPAAQLASRKFASSIGSKLFWRVDKIAPPEQRHTILSFVAFYELSQRIKESALPIDRVITEFALDSVKKWRIPKSLKLTDYGLGHDNRASEYQMVSTVIAEQDRGDGEETSFLNLPKKYLPDQICANDPSAFGNELF